MFAKVKDETNVTAFGYIGESKPDTYVYMTAVQSTKSETTVNQGVKGEK